MRCVAILEYLTMSAQIHINWSTITVMIWSWFNPEHAVSHGFTFTSCIPEGFARGGEGEGILIGSVQVGKTTWFFLQIHKIFRGFKTREKTTRPRILNSLGYSTGVVFNQDKTSHCVRLIFHIKNGHTLWGALSWVLGVRPPPRQTEHRAASGIRSLWPEVFGMKTVKNTKFTEYRIYF